MRSKYHRLAFSGLLVAVMLVLGFVENLIPIGPVPGIRLGLSNSVLMLALYWMGIPSACLLMVVKVVLSGFLFGRVSSMLYAFSGGVLSMAMMIVCIYAVRGVSPLGVGVAGAVSHNVGQVLAAMWILGTVQLVYYMAVLMLTGIATGLATGTATGLLMKHLPPRVLRGMRGEKHEPRFMGLKGKAEKR